MVLRFVSRCVGVVWRKEEGRGGRERKPECFAFIYACVYALTLRKSETEVGNIANACYRYLDSGSREMSTSAIRFLFVLSEIITLEWETTCTCKV